MSDLFQTIAKTRETAAHVLAKSLVDIENFSEIEIAEKIATQIRKCGNLFPEGWYSPPPLGIAVLCDHKPFKRLTYDSLRHATYWPNKNHKLDKETVSMIYCSPINKETKMIGDIGFTMYTGDNSEIRDHIRQAYKTILSIAEYAQVGMSFSDLCLHTEKIIENKFKTTEWITMYTPPTKMNLGHTIPGVAENLSFGENLEDIKNTIRDNRIFVKEIENFKIPESCAFTIESRLEDLHKRYLPSTFFHFIVCFDKSKKTILENFDEIFNTVGMSYMNSK